MWLLNTVDNNMSPPQLAIPMSIKNIMEDTINVFKLIMVCELDNHLSFLEKGLELRHYGYVAKGSLGSPAFSISGFIAKRTVSKVFVFGSVRNTRVDTAIKIDLINSR